MQFSSMSTEVTGSELSAYLEHTDCKLPMQGSTQSCSMRYRLCCRKYTVLSAHHTVLESARDPSDSAGAQLT